MITGVYEALQSLGIQYENYEHPPAPSIEDALPYWNKIDATHCKNIFFRNHKGNRHYLVILKHTRKLAIKSLEKSLKQGKLTFASPKRLMKYLGLEPGSVSVFGLMNDKDNHVHVFLDHSLKNADKLSFHPNRNTATVVINHKGFEKFLKWTGNTYEYVKLYE